MRDSQRGKVYKAERDLPEVEQNGMNIHEVRAWVDKIMRSRWMKSRYPQAYCVGMVDVKDGRGATWARGGYLYIKIPRWARSEFIVLHELSHTIVARTKSKPVASHGREFCSIFLALVRRWMGSEVANRLKAAFKEHRVKYVVRRQA